VKPTGAKASSPRAADSVYGNSAATESRKKPKIQDVAILAGVSLGTVSAVLNGNGRVSMATRNRVRAVISSLGYHPDLYASNLARKSTQVIGLVVSNLQNPFFAETAQAMEEEAARHNHQISLMATNFSPERQRAAVERLLGARIAGIAVITSEHDQGARDLILASGVPSVFLDVGKPIKNSSTICVDSRGGMQAAVEHLIELGHRDLLFVRNSQKGSGTILLSHKLRDEGFAAAVRAYSSLRLNTNTVDISGPGADAGERAIASVIGRVRFTGVVTVTDTVAMGVYRGLQSCKLRIPHDVSVVGFDDTYFCRFLTPPLTTVSISREHLSRMAVEALLQPQRQSGRSRSFKLGTNLILRESTAPPNAKSRTMRVG
jgi:LacI family transcriptional regulator